MHQLQLYLDRAKEPKQKGFPPFEALSARLNELPAPAFQHTARDAAPTRQPHPSSRRRRASDLEWFEERFQELKTMLSLRQVRHERDRFRQRQACRDHRSRRPAFRSLAWRENHGGCGNAARQNFHARLRPRARKARPMQTGSHAPPRRLWPQPRKRRRRA